MLNQRVIAGLPAPTSVLRKASIIANEKTGSIGIGVSLLDPFSVLQALEAAISVDWSRSSLSAVYPDGAGGVQGGASVPSSLLNDAVELVLAVLEYNQYETTIGYL